MNPDVGWMFDLIFGVPILVLCVAAGIWVASRDAEVEEITRRRRETREHRHV